MKILTTFIGVVIYMIFLISCNQKPLSIENLPKFQIQIIDSIKVNELGNYRVVDYLDSPQQYILSVDSRVGDVLVFDKLGKIISSFNNSGESPEGFGDFIIGAGFYQGGQIAIVSRMGLFFYDFKGKLIPKIKRTYRNAGIAYTNFQSKIKFISIKGIEYAVCTLENPAMDVIKTSKEYYQKSKILTLINLKQEKFESFIPYPDKTIYRGDKCFYDVDLPIFTFSKQDSTFYLVYGFEGTIYKVSTDQLNELKIFSDFQPQYMNIMPGESFEKVAPSDKVIAYQYLSGQYYDLFLSNDTLISVYLDGLSKSRVKGNPSFQEYFKIFQKYATSHIQIMVRDKKICQDIALPSQTISLDLVLSNGDLIMPYNKTYANEEKNYELFYVGRIIQN